MSLISLYVSKNHQCLDILIVLNTYLHMLILFDQQFLTQGHNPRKVARVLLQVTKSLPVQEIIQNKAGILNVSKCKYSLYKVHWTLS